MTLYVKCTTDRYELPEAVAESTTELARMIGKTAGSISIMISKGYPGYHRIIVKDEEWYPDNNGGLWRYGKDGSVEYKE